jgi:hypothetical protein
MGVTCPVVVYQGGDVGVALGGEDQMLQALADGVAVADVGEDLQLRVGELDSLRHGQRASVERGEAADGEIIEHLAVAADANDLNELLAWNALLLQRRYGLFERVEKPEVPAAGAPGVLVIGGQIVGHLRAPP